MHQVTFNPTESVDAIKLRAENQTSTLIEFFKFYAAHPEATKYTYQQFPELYTWNKETHIWSPRSASSKAIGRMYFASPNSGERFFLRLLLTICTGPTSFEDLRTVNGEVHETFKDACVAKGMLEDDEEWVTCLEEASIMNTGYQLRRLFSIILTQCYPLRPHNLWTKFATHICDDLGHTITNLFHITNPTEYEIQDYGLHILNKLLQESGKSLHDFPPMPLPTKNWEIVVQNRLIMEHKQLQYEGQDAKAEKNILTFNDDQRKAYELIFSSVQNRDGKTFFLNGGAGTGKTYLYNTIADKCRSLGHIVLTVASSGIASLLLLGGRTAHSTFSLPLNILEDSTCGFTKQSSTAELIRQASLIIWDEVPMQHRFCVETVDRSLKDIRDNAQPFGGLTVVLGGDFRQILPVIPKGTREDIVASTLRRSPLWAVVHVLCLHKNMRLSSNDVESGAFAEYLTRVLHFHFLLLS